MIVSGGVGENRGVELISPSGYVSCSLPNLPGLGRKEHTHDNGLICGGTAGLGTQEVLGHGGDASRTCLNLTSSGWVNTTHDLRSWSWVGYDLGRYRHSSWAVDDGIILMGGESTIGYTSKLVKFDGNSEDAFELIYSSTM